ncbi:iron ABC transporter substrate-binding protein [Aurantiacibacter spongiae]|uniref:Iron ABC transporter substrate-binding protein n=1 Tax=Aurantiacibacter spongiae TaxID=2488860 RepID=A0A3N5CWD7_9SPHN|nr:iron ABC transporter substrate-binding protein [Aurantiacibacter spongiae]
MALWLGGCAAAPASAPAAPGAPTIVSLNPCADAILAQVAAPAQVLALSHYSHDPAASSLPQSVARRYRVTGGTAEEVIALAPDLVVADSFLPPATRAALERAGIRIETVGMVSTLAESEAQVRALARVAGHPAAGDSLVARIEAAWDDYARPGRKLRTLLWQQGGIVPGEATLAAAMLEHAGFASHSAARGLGQGAYLPLEEVLADPPELVLVTGDERALTHPALRARGDIAWRHLDPSLLYCGGPTIPRALARLAAIRDELS